VQTARPTQAQLPSRLSRGFTIVEVMMAAFVMALAIATSLTALQFGLRATDTARNMTLAGQIMQSEIEILRLQNWSQIVALQTAQESPTTPARIDPATTISTGSSTSLDTTLTRIANRFTCTRLVSDITGRDDIKKITLNVAWNGVDGRAHSLSFQTRYAKNGLADYFYVAH
jgi:Tfp pilus assembly protein PilV